MQTGLAALLLNLETGIDQRISAVESGLRESDDELCARIDHLERQVERLRDIPRFLTKLETAVDASKSTNREEIEAVRRVVSELRDAALVAQGRKAVRREFLASSVTLFNWFLSKGWLVGAAVGALLLAAAESTNFFDRRPASAQETLHD